MKLVPSFQPNAQIEMVPLIDAFFLLLAFFISSVLSMTVLEGVPLELPALHQATKLDLEDLIVVTLTEDGRLLLRKDEVGLEGLVEHLRGTEQLETMRVAVRADRAVPTGRLVQVLGAVREAGVSHVGLVTDRAAIERVEPRP